MFEAASSSERRMLSLEATPSKEAPSDGEKAKKGPVPSETLSEEEHQAASPATWNCIWPGGAD